MLICALMLLFALAFTVFALTLPFYSYNGTEYTIMGVRNNSKVIGCLGSCGTVDTNCNGDDATPQCQAIQGIYLTACVLIIVGLVTCAWDVNFMANDESKLGLNFKYGVKNKTFASMSLVCTVLLLVGLLLATQLKEGLSKDGKISDIIEKNKETAKYQEGFFLTIISILLLTVVTILGFISK